MKVYTGSARHAREYLEQDRERQQRVDDYYLAEGNGIAQCFTVDGEGHVAELAALDGNAYEAWVAGVDPDTGQPKGRLRQDDRAVRFVEVVVNGPKSWSLAAELHPDIAAAYEQVHDRAAGQIIGWLGAHATVRVGKRGQQVQVPVERLEAVTVRHYTSRAGDPHRHLHLQINARVFAAGKWRGLHTVGVRDSLSAINGIGHAAVATDPAFRAALAAHGFTLDQSGEIVQLAAFVGAFSRRAAQIEANLGRYESEWSAAHPGERAGPALRRAWEARAWAEGRPDKIIPEPGADLNGRWLRELAELGYRDRDKPIELTSAAVGELDRERAVAVVLARLGAVRSGWNAADIRGEVEQLLARENVVVEAAVRGELAEDLTARALLRCVPLLERDGVPEHIRALTSQPVLQVEDDLIRRLAVRGAEPVLDSEPVVLAHPTDRQLDEGQARAVAALAGDRLLVVIEGAAGAGKTTTLAATRELLGQRGHALLVVTPTLKAAQAARAEIGAQAGSAAWLAHQHGWRWDQHGTWTRLAVGETDPVTGREHTGPGERARLRSGDLVLVDEAAMLDQDTARALLTLADEHGARVAFLGDRHQLPAVGRGGVLDLAHRWADDDARVSLDVVHRFTRQITTTDGAHVTVPDSDYAALTAAMRTGKDPAAVFDKLQERGQIRIHTDVTGQRQVIAEAVHAARRAGAPVSVVADTREQVAALNAAIRDHLIAAGLVDDQHVVTTRAGERIGAGDLIATRRNDRTLQVANRDTWTIVGVTRHGELTVTSRTAGDRTLPSDYVRTHVELAYASTVHGAQGDTTTSAHLVLGEHTGAASAYVGMTRGRARNTVHLVADSIEDAREQWIATFARDRADLGPSHARQLALAEAARYATPRPLPQVLAELHAAWESEARCSERLAKAVPVQERLCEIVTVRDAQSVELAPLIEHYEQAVCAADQAKASVEQGETQIAAQTEQLRERLQAAWTAQRDLAREHGRTLLAGPGRLGWKLVAVNRATDRLAAWSMTWQPILPDMPTGSRQIAHYAARYDYRHQLDAAFERHARAQAEHAHPEHRELLAAVEATGQDREQAAHALNHAERLHSSELSRYGRLVHLPDPAGRLEQLEHDISALHREVTTTREHIAQLVAEPAIATRPPDFLAVEHQTWQHTRDEQRETTQRTVATRAALAAEAAARERMRDAEQHTLYHAPEPDHGPSLGL